MRAAHVFSRVLLARALAMAVRERSLVVAAIAIAIGACASEVRSPSSSVAPTSGQAAATPAILEVPFRTRFEVAFDVPARTVAPDDVRIEARFTTPSGAVLTVGGFPSHGSYHVRFTPRELGIHRYVVLADGGVGAREVARGELRATPGGGSGFIGLDPKDHHRLVREDGQPVYILGENRINVYDPTWNFGNLDTQAYLARMASFGMRTIRVFVFSDCESESVSGGYQIGCLEPAIGRFDEKTADAFDALFDGAERSGIDVVLVAFAIGFTPGADTWKSWVDNPYSVERGGPARSPDELFTSPVLRGHTARKLRYIADRWGSSPRLLAIDLLNEPEWDGPIPEATWIPWAEAMSEAWRSSDPYGHLVTTGSVGVQANIGAGDERPWYASRRNDLVQWHLYGKEFYPPHALAVEMSRKVDETWGFGKPIFCGEFGYGGEDQATNDHTHDGIWSLVFSGAGALAHTAPLFQVDSDEPMTPSRGIHFKVLSDFLRTFELAPLSPAHDVRVTRGKARAWSLVTPDALARGFWVLGDKTTYGRGVSGVEVTVPAPPVGRYVMSWLDDTTGAVVAKSVMTSRGSGELRVAVPTFVRHIAGRMSRDVLPGAEHESPVTRR